MAEVKKINVGPALTVPLALACRGGQITTDGLEKFKVSEKFSAMKEHPAVGKVTRMADMLWTALGMVLILHGAQFKNLFLCTQVIMAFCYGRVQTSVTSLYNDVKTAWDKTSEGEAEGDDSKPVADAKAEPKSENKHEKKRQAAKKPEGKPTQQQREEDAAATKKVLKVLDSDKVTCVAFEFLVSFMACHMVMEGGLARTVVVAHALVKAVKEKVAGLLDFSGHEDMQAWTDLFLTFVLYSFFGAMAIIAAPLALAVNVALCGAQLVTTHSLRIAEAKGKIPDGMTAETFAASVKGLALFGGIAAFGTLWQFWALMADSGMAWYFKLMYLPAYSAEIIVGLF